MPLRSAKAWLRTRRKRPHHTIGSYPPEKAADIRQSRLLGAVPWRDIREKRNKKTLNRAYRSLHRAGYLTPAEFTCFGTRIEAWRRPDVRHEGRQTLAAFGGADVDLVKAFNHFETSSVSRFFISLINEELRKAAGY